MKSKMSGKGGLAILLGESGLGKGKSDSSDEDTEDTESESDSSDEEYVAAEDLLDALKAKDVDGVVEALRAFHECQTMKDES